MSSSCDIVIDCQSSQRISNNRRNSPSTTPSMKIPITYTSSASHPCSNTNNTQHFTALVTPETNSNHNVNTSPITGLALSPTANTDNQLHFGSPFQNFYKLPNNIINVSSKVRKSQFKEKTIQGALSKKRISAFLPVEQIVQNEQEISDNEAVQEIFTENFTHDGHIDDTIRVLSFHPNFLIEHVKFNNYLMYSQGALPYESRHYLAIMAASRHKCLSLVHQQEIEFSSQKGNKSWLMGLEHIPQKLKDINELNKLICHQPWLINSTHIEKLLKNPYNSWSITELMMAVTILTHFHAMSGLVIGCGVEDSYVQELMIKKQLELEENIRLERDRLAQIVYKENQRKRNVRNRRRHNFHSSGVKYNHMNSNETDSEDGEDLEDEDFEDDDDLVDDNNQNEEDEEAIEQYLYNRSHNTDVNGQVLMFRDRSRSASTGTVNRTLSNSSASSFEIGIDSLLKEMQVIQADDKHQKDHIFIKSNDIDLPNQLLLKNTSGSNTLTNSPSSSLASTGHHYLSDLSNCTKTLPINHQKVAWPANHANNFNDAQDENNTDDNQNINVDEDSDLESDFINQNSNMDQDQDEVKDNGIKQLQKHFKKHHHHHSRSASISSRNKNHPNHLTSTANNSNDTSTVNKGSYVLKYVQDPEFGRLNFKNADQSLRLEYYTWENQGYRVANSFYSDIAEFLDKTFRVASQMTYNTLGEHKQVDTSVFRRAVWIYIHSLFGIRYDDYDYNQIKQLLGTPLRKYIKIICSCPERVTKKDYDNILKEITHSEKVHINIVIMEARVQASILYFLRAINSYFSAL